MSEQEKTDNRPLTREERIEIFSEEYVEHSEWWADEMDRLEEVMGELVTVIQEREDTQLATRRKKTKQNGEHRIGIEAIVAGEPWEHDANE